MYNSPLAPHCLWDGLNVLMSCAQRHLFPDLPTSCPACKIHTQILEQPKQILGGTLQKTLQASLNDPLGASPALDLSCSGQGTQTSVSLGLSNVYPVLASASAERQVVGKCLVIRAGALGLVA